MGGKKSLRSIGCVMRCSILIVVTVVLSSYSPTRAATIHVPGNQPTIQGAIDAASAGDEIVVGPGTYQEKINFGGKAITLRSLDGPTVTIIDAAGLNDSVIRCVSGEGPDTVLRGFTITGGSAIVGGGMWNESSSPTVIDCIFTGNTATDRGGGMYNFRANPTVIGCAFVDNFASAMGGGMFNRESSPTVTDSTFRENTSNKGGGMRNYINSHPTVSNSVFSRNSAFEEGGGMDNRKNSNPTVTNCTFIENTAASGGGGMHNYVGMAVATGNPTVTNCLFLGNRSGQGGGMRNNDPSPIVTNCVFVGNVGSAMSNRNDSVPLLTNCILWDNTGGPFHGAGSPVVTFSDVGGGFTGTGNIDEDPMFLDPNGPDGDPATWEDNNYRLADASPCIDAGDNTAVPPDTADLDNDADRDEPTPVDLDGNPRFDELCTPACPGSEAECGEAPIVDMGVYESPDNKTIAFESDAKTISWEAVAGAASYNIFRGSTSGLEDSDGDGLPDSGYGECVNHLDLDSSDTSFRDDEAPGPGDAFFYLMSFIDAHGADSGLGATGECQPRVIPGPC